MNKKKSHSNSAQPEPYNPYRQMTDYLKQCREAGLMSDEEIKTTMLALNIFWSDMFFRR